jgi:hypothetical protein
MKKTTKKVSKNIIKNIPKADYNGVIAEDLRDKLNQVIDGMHMGFERMDRQFGDVYQRFDGIDQCFDRLENRVGGIEIELSQIKDVVLDIQQEKAPREDVLALAKRVTKLEMNSAKSINK